jgi:hypothetical protein
MWDAEDNCEYLYLPDGRIVRYSKDSTDRNLFALWLAESL